jgi:hypothetical protein
MGNTRDRSSSSQSQSALRLKAHEDRICTSADSRKGMRSTSGIQHGRASLGRLVGHDLPAWARVPVSKTARPPRTGLGKPRCLHDSIFPRKCSIAEEGGWPSRLLRVSRGCIQGVAVTVCVSIMLYSTVPTSVSQLLKNIRPALTLRDDSNS